MARGIDQAAVDRRRVKRLALDLQVRHDRMYAAMVTGNDKGMVDAAWYVAEALTALTLAKAEIANRGKVVPA